jgi:type IV secretory pathway component VirB8
MTQEQQLQSQAKDKHQAVIKSYELEIIELIKQRDHFESSSHLFQEALQQSYRDRNAFMYKAFGIGITAGIIIAIVILALL